MMNAKKKKKKGALETGLFVEQLKRLIVSFCFRCSLKLFAFSTGAVCITFKIQSTPIF